MTISIPEDAIIVNWADDTTTFIVPDGPHYDEEIREYGIWLDGEVMAWHSGTEMQANARYNEILATRNAHIRRNELNAFAEPIINWQAV